MKIRFIHLIIKIANFFQPQFYVFTLKGHISETESNKASLYRSTFMMGPVNMIPHLVGANIQID